MASIASIATRHAPAKINLHLAVGMRREDGYHPLRSLMVALDGLADTVTLARSDRRRVDCPGVPERENLAWRALDLLEARVDRELPCAVRIEKRIPAQAGLGGGSSDAAATLLLADEVFDLGLSPRTLEAVAADVGSDVPFFVRGGTQWASGRGEILEPATAPDFVALIVFPGFGLSTADVYRAFDALHAPPGGAAVDTSTLRGILRNDLWPAARECRPALADLDAALRAVGARDTLLCGSGTAMAGFFADEEGARAAAEDSFEHAPVAAVVRPLAPHPPRPGPGGDER